MGKNSLFVSSSICGMATQAAELKDDLTEEQLKVARLGPDEQALVTAGAGTGKTRLLVARVAHLLGESEVHAGEMLILTFTRAAVQEIRDRLSESDSGAGAVPVRTFDSFATRLLAQIDPDGSWSSASFEGRISAAAEAIATDPAAGEVCATYRHVLVDELQDLVHPRDDLVLELLRSSSGGFTLFGDPAQAIYGFQVKGGKTVNAGADFWPRLRKEFPQIQEMQLTRNFRARSELTRDVLQYGPRLSKDSAEFAELHRELSDVINDLTSLGSPPEAAAAVNGGYRRTAILCRSNWEALTVSRALWNEGVDHVLQRSAKERPVAAWVARVTRGLPHPKLKESRFRERFGDLEIEEPPADTAWAALRRLSRTPTGSLDLTEASRRVALGDVPPELVPAPRHALTVSTIHRSKGLEFDCVLLMDAFLKDGIEEVDIAEEARVLYVALTRARDEILHLERQKPPGGCWYQRQLDERWVLRRQPDWSMHELEIKGDDLHSAHPAGVQFMAEDAGHLQDLIGGLPRGQVVDFELIPGSISNDGAPPVYRATVDGVSVGVTREEFGKALRWKWRHKVPIKFEGARVDSLDTVAGSGRIGADAGLGASGLWLRPRVVGLAQVHWS